MPRENQDKNQECLWILTGKLLLRVPLTCPGGTKPMPQGNQGGKSPSPASGAFGCQGGIQAGTVNSDKREEWTHEEWSKDKRKSLNKESSVGMPSWAELKGYYRPVHPR